MLKPRPAVRNPIKITILLALILVITTATAAILTAYPQHLVLDKGTVIESIAFTGNNTATIKGSQVQFGSGDLITLSGRDYIRITGRQIQIGDASFAEAVRTVTADLTQNVLFSQSLGTFDINRAAQVGVDKTVFNLIPISQDALNVNVAGTSTSYTVQFIQGTVYVNEKGVMLKLSKQGNKIYVSVIGLKKYNNIWMKVI